MMMMVLVLTAMTMPGTGGDFDGVMTRSVQGSRRGIVPLLTLDQPLFRDSHYLCARCMYPVTKT
eukprot:360861-Chlamydomonas_euryale.AAC.5